MGTSHVLAEETGNTVRDSARGEVQAAMARSEAQGGRRETGSVHIGGNWEEEDLMGRKTGNLLASTNCSTRRSSDS